MIELNDEKLKKLQSVELEMLTEIDRICRKNDINYSLDGGTLLGAIRHDGFIPWDDDADVVMLRSEYEKFFEVCKKDLDKEKFFLQEYRTDEYYRWGYSKLRRNNTLFLREGQEHIKCRQGVFLDIFICDNVPDNLIKRKINLFKCFCIRKGLYSDVGRFVEKKLFWRIWFRIINMIPRKVYVKKLNKIIKKNNIKGSLVAHYTYPYPKKCKYGMPSECFDEYIDKEFEGKKFKVFKKYDLYLNLLYGDYMKLPPIEKRKVHPVSEFEV